MKYMIFSQKDSHNVKINILCYCLRLNVLKLHLITRMLYKDKDFIKVEKHNDTFTFLSVDDSMTNNIEF